MDLDARLRDVVRVGQHQISLSADKQLGENLPEILVDLLKAFGEQLAHLCGQLADKSQQLGAGALHIVRLHLQKAVSALHLAIFLDGSKVDRTQCAYLVAQLGQTVLPALLVLDRLCLCQRVAAGHIVFVPQLCNQLVVLSLQGGPSLLAVGKLCCGAFSLGNLLLSVARSPVRCCSACACCRRAC